MKGLSYMRTPSSPLQALSWHYNETSQKPTSLDFPSIHIYPKSGQIEKDLETLKKFAVGKPLLVEEFFRSLCPREQTDPTIPSSAGLLIHLLHVPPPSGCFFECPEALIDCV